MTIRPAVASDIDGMLVLLRELHALHVAAAPERFLPHAAADSDPALLGRLLERADQLLLVATDGERLLGYVRAEARRVPQGLAHRARACAEVHEIAVARDARGQGIGQALMGEVRGWAAAQGLATIELGVYAFNSEAIAFYRRLGFKDLRATLSLAVAGPSGPTGPQ